MKKALIIVILLLVVAGSFLAFRVISFSSAPPQAQADADIKDLRHATLAIDGMWCASCAVGAEYALKETPGVANASVGFTENLKGRGEVIYNPRQASLDAITQALMPYKATVTNDAEATALGLEEFPK